MESQIRSTSFKILKQLFPTLRKLCIVTSSFPPCPTKDSLPLGGIFAKYVQLAEELRYLKQAFFAISLYYWNHSADQDGPDVRRVGKYRPYSISRRKYLYFFFEFFNPFVFEKCIRIFQTERPDVVLIGEMWQMSLGPILAAKILGIPVVIEHDWICPAFPGMIACSVTRRLTDCGCCLEKMFGNKQNRIVKFGFGFFSAFMYLVKKNIWNRCIVFAESAYTNRLYVEWGIKAEVIHRVPPTPTVDPFTECDSAFEKTLRKQVGGSKTLVYVGRLSNEKGVALLIQSYKMLKEKINGSIKLVIAGDGPLKGLVVKESQDDEGILYLGWLERERLKCVYMIADVVAIPSVCSEAYPHVALEALAFNKKIVGFDLGALKEISRQNPNMILVEHLSPEAYSNKILEIIER